MSFTINFEVKEPYWVEFDNYIGLLSIRGMFHVETISDNYYRCSFANFNKDEKSSWEVFAETLDEAKDVCYQNHSEQVLAICRDFVNLKIEGV